jgi:predicted membrane chloride channel (bestrophin family)
MSKKWVFEELVSGDKDFVGLIAYSLYKFQKHTLATNLRQSGSKEDEIALQTQNFHDATINSGQMDALNTKASQMLNDMVEQTLASQEKVVSNKVQELMKNHRQELEKKDQKHKKELLTQERKLITKITRLSVANEHWLSRLWKWVWSGVPSACATLLVTFLIYAGAMIMVDEDKRQEILSSAVEKIVGVKEQP